MDSYRLLGWILLSPLFHVIRGLGDALGLHSSDTSFPSVAMTRTGLGANTGGEAAEDTGDTGELKDGRRYGELLPTGAWSG